MAELCPAVPGHVVLQLLPVVAVVPHAAAVAADQEQSAQLLDLGERLLELPDPLRQLPLQRDHADAHGEPGAAQLGAWV